MSKRVLTILLLIMVASLALTACGGEEFECTDAIGCVDVAPDEPIHLAYMLTISGATAFLGEDSKGAVEIAIEDRGEVLGHELQLTGEDSLCSAEGGQTAATKVSSDPSVIGVIGTNCSSAMTAAMDTISASGMLICSPSNTAPALTDDSADGTWKPGYYRAAHNDLFQGRVAADFAFNELGARSAATIHDGSPYADQLQQVFATRFEELGGTVTFQGAVNIGDTDMRPVLTSVAADSPDVLYYPIFEPEGPFITAQAAEIAGLEGTTLMGADGLLAVSFPPAAGENAVGMYLSGPYITGENYETFLVTWDEKFGGVPPSGFHAFAFDCTNMILDAVEKAAVVDDDGTVHIGRQALRDAMSETSNFNGLTGTLSCTDTGDCATGEALGIYEISDAEVTGGNWPPTVVWTP